MLRDILCSSTGARSSPGCLDDGPSAFFHILNLIGTEAVKIGACCMCCGGFIQHLILPAQLVSQKKKKQAQYGTSVCAPGIMSFFVLKNGAGLHCFTCACTRAFVLQAVSSHHSMAV